MPVPQIDKATQVVHSHDVVGMLVGQDKEVDPLDLVGDALQAEFRSRINLDG
jgi:hypothetical protein